MKGYMMTCVRARAGPKWGSKTRYRQVLQAPVAAPTGRPTRPQGEEWVISHPMRCEVTETWSKSNRFLVGLAWGVGVIKARSSQTEGNRGGG